MASPPAPPHGEGASASAVCCMCGDHGLPGELVRCRRCRVRLQHRYCSDLYPRAAAYRRCNWCLREPPAPDHGGRAAHAAATADKPEEKRKAASASSASSEEERQRQRQRQRHEGWCSSRRSPAEPAHPVKKKHKAEEKMPPPAAPAASGSVADTSDSKEVMRAGKTRVSRVKVRRYKLLAEVISC